MKHKNIATPRTLVVSLGGSLVVPNGQIDTLFLTSFVKLISRQLKRGWKFVIVVGGGGTARAYQRAADEMATLTRDDLDWLGIHATRLNAHLLRTLFRDVAHPVVIKDPSRCPKKMHTGVMIAAGWKPGWSTDYVAARIAKRLGASMIVNLSNVDVLYDRDPNKDKQAVPIYKSTWKIFRQIVGDEWDPGMSAPFDPIASKLAQREKMTVTLMNGKNIKNLNAFLSSTSFEGTVIAG